MDTVPTSPKEADITSVPAKHSRRRSRSFCGSPTSSPSSCSSTLDSSLSPFSPLRFSGIPFKWEQQPGIPKQPHSPVSKPPHRDLLPLPPAGGAAPQRLISLWKKKTHGAKFAHDPFAAALLQCSLPDDECWKSSRVSQRTLSDRFGFIDLYGSCKSSCSVVDSKVLIRRSAYDMLSRRIP